MYVLGINETHSATAALLKDGKIIACASEERFTKVKKQSGYPKQAVSFCLNYGVITIDDIDLLVFGGSNPLLRFFYSREDLQKISSILNDFLLPIYEIFPSPFIIGEEVFRKIHKLGAKLWKQIHVIRLSRLSKVPRKKICYFDHHLAHAASAYYIFPPSHKPKLVITNDSSGDGSSGKVYLVKENNWIELASSSNRLSLASIYYYVTKVLGFKGDEEEYKVMGLAGYTSQHQLGKLTHIFQKLIILKDMTFKGQLPYWLCLSYLKKKLFGERFDFVAGSLQNFVENLLCSQVAAAINKTKVTDVVLGGGLAMNIKANMKVSQINKLKSLMIGPSCGDEANAFGYCFLGYRKRCQMLDVKFQIQPVKNLNLGPGFSEEEIKNAVLEITAIKIKRVKREELAKEVAKLLYEGKIVARFAGRMEFGHRSLGNRSILADPRDARIVKIINDQIKRRDFWMPFAPTILKERVKDYLINPKGLESPFMMIGFETTKQGREQIPATLHPYDFTCRPQILSKEDNPDYWKIIKEFEDLSGVGAVLNTSFNLHGEPIVCTPQDALRVFQKSGLEYMILENYLIRKL